MRVTREGHKGTSLSGVWRNQKGFTLIEVMIALVVLVVGVIGVMSMQLLTIKGNADAMAISRAVQDGSAVLDMVNSLNFGDNKLAEGAGKTMTTLYGANPNFKGTVTYNVQNRSDVQLKALFNLKDDFPGTEAKLITVSSVKRAGGSDKTINLQYLKIDQ